MSGGVTHLFFATCALKIGSAGTHSVSTQSYTLWMVSMALGLSFAFTHGGMRLKAGLLSMFTEAIVEDLKTCKSEMQVFEDAKGISTDLD
jgi:hypothetical protein